jgi:hypothetical protein
MKKNKISIFDIITSLSQSKEDRWFEFENIYSPFIINKFLAMNDERIGLVEMMNRSKLSKKEQYYFYLYSIPNKRRYFKYIKDYKSENVDVLCKYYSINKQKSKDYLKLLDQKQINNIKRELPDFQV